MTSKFALTTGAAMIIAGAPLAALAQNSNTAPGVASAAVSAASDTAAATAQDSAGSLGEIVVTARRRAENSQTVPISVTAFSEKQIESAGITDFRRLDTVAPSLGMAGQFQDYLILSLRGQQSVQMYFNEGLIPYNAGSGVGSTVGGAGLFFDLQNIQVLNGPQGTLFGRNTTGGAILFQSKRPDNNFGGYVSATYGNYNDRELEAAINVPIVEDKLLARIAFDGQARDGYTKTESTPDHPGGLDLDDRNYWAVRGTLAFKPTDWFKNDLIVNTYDSRNNGSSAILYSVNPTAKAATAYPQLLSIFQQQQRLGIRSQVPIDLDTFTRSKMTIVNNITEISLSDNITFRHIFDYTFAQSDRVVDYDGTSLPIVNRFTAAIQPSSQQLFTFEPQLVGNSFNKSLAWVVGYYHLDNPTPFATFQTVSYGTPSSLSTRSHDMSDAAYGQGTYDLSAWIRGLKFTAGARYTWDRPHIENRTVNAAGVCTTNPCTIVVRQANFQAPSWTLGLDYQIRPNAMVYVTSRRSYRSGGFNNQAPTPDLLNYGPEYVTDVELGTKVDWHVGGMPVRTNLAVYHQDYGKIQTTQTVIGAPGQAASYSITNNSAAAGVWGAELSGDIRPTDNLTLGATGDWLDFQYTSFDPGVDAGSYKRTVLYLRPRFKYGLNATYALPLKGNLGLIELSGQWNWQSKTSRTNIGDLANFVPQGAVFQDPYGLLNLNVDWKQIGGSPVTASVFVTNATNQVYANGGLNLYSTQGFAALNYGEPRMFGVRLKYEFGK